MSKVHLLPLFGALCVWATSASADVVADQGALAKMPVKEITVFKDGHAFVLHAGKMPTDAAGNVQMDYLPMPVIGTFWPYSADKNVKLSAVTASPRLVKIEHTALNQQELIDANPGAEVHITERNGKSYTAQIVGVPERSSEEQEKTSPPNSGEKLPEAGSVLLLKIGSSTTVLPRDAIQELTFMGAYKRTLAREEFRNLLTLKLEWPGGKAAKSADVGMVYLQKGIRWIPSYKVSLDGKGNAMIALEATLINEMTDLEDVTANLVIGVPSFSFQDTPDPIGLQQTFAQLSSYFQPGSQTNYAMSNAMMSQVGGQGGGGFGGGPGGRGGERVAPGEAPANIGPDVAGSGKNEDMFVFTVKHITLKKGQRMVLPVSEMTLKYKDVYTVDLAFAPPREMRQNVNINEQQLEALRLQNAPKALHKIRITNAGKYPLTTAPALILSDGKVLAQGMMTYASIGGEEDLTLTTAVDIKIKKTDNETARTPNAEKWENAQFLKVDLAGKITLSNYLTQSVEIEVTRNVLGNVLKADHDGKPTMINLFEEDDYGARAETPNWWSWYSWPAWWSHFNSVGRIAWNVRLDPGKSVDLNYTWNYFWIVASNRPGGGF
ncbi:MAG TPA: hypothetical protein VKU00_03165 [Chthonomonadaceae bacterium]|nr:hypothetical protein [Chthonomonadaceae bacterium]